MTTLRGSHGNHKHLWYFRKRQWQLASESGLPLPHISSSVHSLISICPGHFSGQFIVVAGGIEHLVPSVRKRFSWFCREISTNQRIETSKSHQKKPLISMKHCEWRKSHAVQCFCEWMQSFSVQRNTFARKKHWNKCFPPISYFSVPLGAPIYAYFQCRHHKWALGGVDRTLESLRFHFIRLFESKFVMLLFSS